MSQSTSGDGTQRLCRALYGREPEAADFLGGSEARMLHDAATVIEITASRNGIRSKDECGECGRSTAGEATWPGNDDAEICQECWEAECSRSWWAMVNAINATDEA